MEFLDRKENCRAVIELNRNEQQLVKRKKDLLGAYAHFNEQLHMVRALYEKGEATPLASK